MLMVPIILSLVNSSNVTFAPDALMKVELLALVIIVVWVSICATMKLVFWVSLTLPVVSFAMIVMLYLPGTVVLLKLK